MNKKMILYRTGQIVGVESICLMAAALVSLIYREKSFAALLISAFAAAVIYCFSLFFRPKEKDQYFFAKDGFVTVTLSWIMLSLIGALPFTLSGEIPSYVDSLFETVSGLTTTGASIMENVESMSHGTLFWRSFTHWIGGMGVLVLVMAITPSESGRSIHMMRAEMPGPVVGKLVPKLRDTAKILYIIYLVMTFAMAILLLFGGMSLFESLVHAFGTAGTGGFGIKNDSLASYNGYIQWVVAIFMLLFGVNFNLYYLILLGRVSSALKSRELWFFGCIVLAASVAIGVNIYPVVGSVGGSAREAVFHVASIVSTTGFSVRSLEAYPAFTKGLLFVLMFFGGCAGSTAGGLKLSRLMLLGKMVKCSLEHTLHPRSVQVVKLEGKPVEKETLDGVAIYFALYIMCIAILFLVLSLCEPFSIESNLTAAVSTFNNVGPAFGAAAASYAPYSAVSKLAMSVAMLLGRLEIYPILLAVSPATWRKK